MAEPNPTAPPPAPATEPTPKPVVRSDGTRPTRPTNPADMSPQERWLADKAAADRADPWLDGSRVLARNKAGELVQHEKVVAADGTVTIGKVLDDDGRPVAGDDAKPPAADERAGDAKIKVGDVEFSEQEIRDAIGAKAEADLRKTQIPASAEGYKAALPADLKLPGDMKFELAGFDHPVHGAALRDAAAWAHKNGLSQSQFSELLGLHAGSMAREAASLAAAARAEREALGALGGSRVDAVSRWLMAHYPEAARPMLSTLVTRAQVECFESIIARLTNQGGGFSRRGDVSHETQSPTDEEWNKMSYTAQKEYAERSSQNGSGRRR
jgi:hypothetical protein